MNAIEIENIWKKFRVYREKNQTLKEILLRRKKAEYEEFWALKDINFLVPKGTMLGIIGENGSGKSTLLKILARILRPDKGKFLVNGKISALLELGAGFHPELTGRENVYLNGSILGLSQKEIKAKFDEIVDFSELDKFIDTPVKNYSSGMYLRLGFAVAVNVEPDILLIDEVLAVGDEAFQRKCSDKIFEFKSKKKTIILVSHNLQAVRNLCDTVIWLDESEIKASGKANEVTSLYLNKVYEDEQVRAGRQSEKQSLGSRTGTREVEIAKVVFCDGNGQEAQSFRTNDKFIARIYYQVNKKVDRPVFGVAIYRNDGTLITGPNTKVHRFEIDSINLTGYVEYKINSLPLLPGNYQFTAAIYDYHCLHAYDHHERMYGFKILPSGSGELYGLTQIPCEWKHVVDDVRSENERISL